MFYIVTFKVLFCSNAFAGRKSNQKIAYFQPLTILEIEAVHTRTKAPRTF
jgi:DNA repair protein RecO (recombination protein O)